MLHFVEQEADFLSGAEIRSILLGRLNELWFAIWPQGNADGRLLVFIPATPPPSRFLVVRFLDGLGIFLGFQALTPPPPKWPAPAGVTVPVLAIAGQGCCQIKIKPDALCFEFGLIDLCNKRQQQFAGALIMLDRFAGILAPGINLDALSTLAPEEGSSPLSAMMRHG